MRVWRGGGHFCVVTDIPYDAVPSAHVTLCLMRSHDLFHGTIPEFY